jgi:hypothetical protein
VLDRPHTKENSNFSRISNIYRGELQFCADQEARA